jgi:ribokinase
VGGKGANQAIAIARAGGLADFYGTIGHDGLWIKKKLAAFGLNDSGILVADVRILFFVYHTGYYN